MKMRKLWWVGVAILASLGKWANGFVEFSLNETELSFVEEGYGVSKAFANPLLVGLTLIQGANAKGAGTLFLFFSFLFFCQYLDFF